jgi:hypothetical protein
VNDTGDVEAFVDRVKESRSRLRDIDLGDMTVFGPWTKADEVPMDVREATSGRGRDPGDKLGDLVDGTGKKVADMERAYFLVRITAASPATAAAAGASQFVWNGARVRLGAVAPSLRVARYGSP